jgi:hypothetical protein
MVTGQNLEKKIEHIGNTDSVNNTGLGATETGGESLLGPALTPP